MKTIKLDKAKELINKSNGRIFAATYIKKDNSHRLIVARLGKHYQPKTNRKQPYKPSKYNLLPVYDMKIKAFRMLNLDTLLTLSINKSKYKV
tara:strand:+ start:181 stop:456 length:276 start_codon:yes stop_codon:yes gene_type:complete